MTAYSLVLKASTAELASVVWRFEKGRKHWHDSTVILLASLAAGIACLRGDGLGDAAYLGLIGGVAAQIVWIIAQRRRSRKYLTGLAASDFNGLVIRDQDLAPDLAPDQLQTLLDEWKS